MRQLVPIGVGMCLACGPDRADNASARCADNSACDAGSFCYRSFCIPEPFSAAKPEAGAMAGAPTTRAAPASATGMIDGFEECTQKQCRAEYRRVLKDVVKAKSESCGCDSAHVATAFGCDVQAALDDVEEEDG